MCDGGGGNMGRTAVAAWERLLFVTVFHLKGPLKLLSQGRDEIWLRHLFTPTPLAGDSESHRVHDPVQEALRSGLLGWFAPEAHSNAPLYWCYFAFDWWWFRRITHNAIGGVQRNWAFRNWTGKEPVQSGRKRNQFFEVGQSCVETPVQMLSQENIPDKRRTK